MPCSVFSCPPSLVLAADRRIPRTHNRLSGSEPPPLSSQGLSPTYLLPA
ncbi:hypothetical protein CH63R_14497 [Colletotrichum higginsianum IMI 349063]|uniref:Uncharacterized protein n=1 Tax=Colletotrichum higginsianum (strain IMI 349063) TaxID=759273 RepID=A0A1B7XR11_COLHI|nr:hypothetical protein CH63R_14497 [Colletotrichum higginsianum IMI 349063]OBR02196.1 hypothetical protein CH63R_14497 [Colletotrichum higginsianum IMI 349063]